MGKYEPEQQQAALDLYLQVGSAEAARQLDIPARTIRYWATTHGLTQARAQKAEAARAQLAVLHAEYREELRVRLLEKALDALGRMDEPHVDFKGKDATPVTYPMPSPSGYQSYATAAGILIDKYRLEMGETTSRVAHETGDDVDRAYRQLMAEVDRRAEATRTKGDMEDALPST